MILMVGSTGDLGNRVVRQLRGREEPVRCLVRPQTDAADLEALGAQVVRGDLTDPASLRSACTDIDTVVCTATAIGRRLAAGSGPSIREVDEVGVAALIAAAEGAGVTRFVYVSYAGVDAGLRFPLERAKVATEKRLRASAMKVSIIRPDAFQDLHLVATGGFDLRAGKVAVIGKGATRTRWVSAEDVAALTAAVAVEPAPPPLIEFGGPESISRNEAIAVAERLVGRKMKRRGMPRFLARTAMRVLARPNPALASVFGLGLQMELSPQTWDDAPLRARGIEPRSATDFIGEQARALGG